MPGGNEDAPQASTQALGDQPAVVLVAQMPRGKGTIGLYIRVLDDFLERHPGDDALLNSYRWLPEPGQADLLGRP